MACGGGPQERLRFVAVGGRYHVRFQAFGLGHPRARARPSPRLCFPAGATAAPSKREASSQNGCKCVCVCVHSGM